MPHYRLYQDQPCSTMDWFNVWLPTRLPCTQRVWNHLLIATPQTPGLSPCTLFVKVIWIERAGTFFQAALCFGPKGIFLQAFPVCGVLFRNAWSFCCSLLLRISKFHSHWDFTTLSRCPFWTSIFFHLSPECFITNQCRQVACCCLLLTWAGPQRRWVEISMASWMTLAATQNLALGKPWLMSLMSWLIGATVKIVQRTVETSLARPKNHFWRF